MKLRNLLSVAVLAGLGVSAMPAAAFFKSPPIYGPSNCRVTMEGPPHQLDVRDLPWAGFYRVRCTTPALPGWLL